MTTNKLSQKIFVVDAQINIWSGQRKLDAADIRLGQGGELPPEKVANLGNKKIADPKMLTPFHRIKTALRRYLDEIGMSFLGGWACPLDKFDEVKAKMEQYQAEYEAEKLTFLAGYDRRVEEWLAENPEYEEQLRRGVMHRDDVEKRIRFAYTTFKLSPAVDDGIEGQRLERRVESLGDDLMQEIADAASRFADNLIGRSEINVTTGITLKGLRDKIAGLAFLNGNLQPVVDILTETLAGYQLHRDGRNIVAPFIYQVQAVALTLSDVSRIERFARGEIDITERAKEVEQMETGHYPVIPSKSAHPLQAQIEVEPESKATMAASTSVVTPVVEEPQEPVAESEEKPAVNTSAPAGADLFADLDDLFPTPDETVEAKPAIADTASPVEQEVHVQPEPEMDQSGSTAAKASAKAPALTVVSDVVVTAPAVITELAQDFDADGLDGFGF